MELHPDFSYKTLNDPQKGLVPYLAKCVKTLIVKEDTEALQKLIDEMAVLSRDIWDLIGEIDKTREEYEAALAKRRELEEMRHRAEAELKALEEETRSRFQLDDPIDDIDSIAIEDLVDTAKIAESGFVFDEGIDALAAREDHKEEEEEKTEPEDDVYGFDFGSSDAAELDSVSPSSSDSYIPIDDMREMLSGTDVSDFDVALDEEQEDSKDAAPDTAPKRTNDTFSLAEAANMLGSLMPLDVPKLEDEEEKIIDPLDFPFAKPAPVEEQPVEEAPIDSDFYADEPTPDTEDYADDDGEGSASDGSDYKDDVPEEDNADDYIDDDNIAFDESFFS